MAPAFARWPLLAAFASLAAVGAAAQDVATYRNERHGFSLSYPAGTFTPQPNGDDGRSSSRATAMRGCWPARCPTPTV